MAVSLQQTDAAANAGALALDCSGRSENADIESNQGSQGGSAGSTPRTISVDGNASDLNALWMELDLPNGYDGADGDWTLRFTISTANHQITMDAICFCHVDSSYSLKHTVNQGVGFAENLAAAQEYVITGLSQGGAWTDVADGDKVIVILGFDSGSSMAQDIAYVPSSIITAPGSVPSSFIGPDESDPLASRPRPMADVPEAAVTVFSEWRRAA